MPDEGKHKQAIQAPIVAFDVDVEARLTVGFEFVIPLFNQTLSIKLSFHLRMFVLQQGAVHLLTTSLDAYNFRALIIYTA